MAFYREKRGFTLTEIMVVVMILATLLLIIVPGYRSIRYRVRLNACRANMKTLYNAATLYLFDKPGVTLPGAGNGNENNIFQMKLVNEKYLKYFVRCPSFIKGEDGFYAITNENDTPEAPLKVECIHIAPGHPKHGWYNGKYEDLGEQKFSF